MYYYERPLGAVSAPKATKKSSAVSAPSAHIKFKIFLPPTAEKKLTEGEKKTTSKMLQAGAPGSAQKAIFGQQQKGATQEEAVATVTRDSYTIIATAMGQVVSNVELLKMTNVEKKGLVDTLAQKLGISTKIGLDIAIYTQIVTAMTQIVDEANFLGLDGVGRQNLVDTLFLTLGIIEDKKDEVITEDKKDEEEKAGLPILLIIGGLAIIGLFLLRK